MKRLSAVALALTALVILTGCPSPQGEVGTEIISAQEAIELAAANDTVLVDARTLLDYRKGHVEGAVNVSRADIVVNEPFVNLLAPPEQIAAVMSERGVANSSTVVIYDDNNNMDAARLWYTLRIYGHENVKVVSGGLEALRREGAGESTVAPPVQQTTYVPGPLNEDWLATQSDLREQVNNPDPNTVVIDTRSLEEYTEGTIPGSICLDYVGNNFADGTYRPPRQIQIRYIEAGFDFDNTGIMFCKTSIRGAQTFLALYDAGYRDLKLYDAAWVEWSGNPMNEIYVPEGATIQLEASDVS